MTTDINKISNEELIAYITRLLLIERRLIFRIIAQTIRAAHEGEYANTLEFNAELFADLIEKRGEEEK